MEINADKTKAMILNKSGKFFRSFTFNSEFLFTTNSYKYLGFIVTQSKLMNDHSMKPRERLTFKNHLNTLINTLVL